MVKAFCIYFLLTALTIVTFWFTMKLNQTIEPFYPIIAVLSMTYLMTRIYYTVFGYLYNKLLD